MRKGANPEKSKGEKNILKEHRVVVVFYVPESDEPYFSDLDLVLDKCLESLTKTINPDITNITLVNNGSAALMDAIVDKYRPLIDKYVHYADNKGKVYAVLQETRSMHEKFVTVTDADILFFKGWEKAVFEVFSSHPKAGVVSPYPSPYTTFYFNKTVFGLPSLANNIGYGKFVADADINMYVTGVNLPKIIDRKTRYNWKEKQLILKTPTPAVIGAFHVVSTYRIEQFRNQYTFPEIKFRNGYEEDFIDCLAEKMGMYRLSTIQTFAYHLGNTPNSMTFNGDAPDDKADASMIRQIKPFKTWPKLFVWLQSTLGRIFMKLKWNR